MCQSLGITNVFDILSVFLNLLSVQWMGIIGSNDFIGRRRFGSGRLPISSITKFINMVIYLKL